MKKIYIVHPFQGKEENRKKIDSICKAVANMGYLPISPVHAFSFLDDNIPEEREKALRFCKELVKNCDQAWCFGEWEKSEGCSIEIAVAKRSYVPVLDIDFLISHFSELKEVIK